MKKSINYYMRSLHGDIGFIVLGLTIIYSLSGIVLIYRQSDFLKSEKQIEVQLSPNLSELELGAKLEMRHFKISEKTDNYYIFEAGSYNRENGLAVYNKKSLPILFEKLIGLHKVSNKSKIYWATTIYGVLLFFLAISSLWMFKPNSKRFKRGIILSVTGLVVAIVLLLL
ncbi:hypothetical protein [Labilibaculum sp.]|uniref:hypothetical protein n=1 Tax=Labilibaculum sp. TaxID=2060723 RepID=UPI003567AC9A